MNIAQARRDETTLPKRNRSPRRRQDYVTIALFLLPAFVLFLLFLIYPIVQFRLLQSVQLERSRACGQVCRIG